jgi:hypothetical protein
MDGTFKDINEGLFTLFTLFLRNGEFPLAENHIDQLFQHKTPPFLEGF